MADLKQHYAALASNYEEHWLYSGEYVRNLSHKIADALQLQPDDRLADIGCGTGLYARALRDVVPLRPPVLCVDSSEDMLRHAKEEDGLITRKADAISFLEGDISADKYLMKEVVHHIEDKERLFGAISTALHQNAIFLILLLPPRISYPLFREALDLYEKMQPDYRVLCGEAEARGLAVESWVDGIELRINKKRYLRMVKGRYMSLLSHFSDAAIAQGVKEIDASHDDELKFHDNFVYLRLTHG